MKNWNAFKEKIKNIDADSLVSYGILNPAKNSGYICPACSNGTGSDGTGMEFNQTSDGYKGYCFRCESYFDVIDLIGFKYNLDPSGDFKEIMERAEDIFGAAPAIQKKTPQKPKIVKNYQKLLYASLEQLYPFMEKQKTWRGLTLQTLLHFHCGFLQDWAATAYELGLYDGAMDHTPRVIIPTSNYHFLARYAYSDAPASVQKLKQHRNAKDIFGLGTALKMIKDNPKQIIFSVEGEIDAMSIYQSGFAAIAYGGKKITDKMINQLKNFPPATQFIQMFDSDEAGQKANETTKEILEDAGFIVEVMQLEGNFKDANEFLENDPKGLKKVLQKLIDNFAPPLNQNKKSPTTAQGISSCPVDLEIPPGYFFSSEGIFENPTNRKGEVNTKKKILISFNPCVPVKILQADNGGQTQLELARYDRVKKTWSRFQTELETISSTQGVISLAQYNIHVTSKRASSLSAFLTDIFAYGDNQSKLKFITIYNQPGWTNNDCENFIYPISPDESYIVQCQGYDYAAAYKEKGNVDDWINLFKEVYLSGTMARYVLGLALAGPLVRCCDTRNFQGVLVAKTGAGKSALVKLAASIFGNPSEIKRTFHGTTTFLDEIAPIFTDMFSWVDEFQSANIKVRENIVTTIYNYSEEISKGRVKRMGGVRVQTKFRGTRIYTAEQKLLVDSATQGAVNRLIELETNNVIPNSLAEKIHKTLNKTYGHFGQIWYDFVLKNKDALKNFYEKIYKSDTLNSYACHQMFVAHKQQLSLCFCALQKFVEVLIEKNFLPANFPQPKNLFADTDLDNFLKILPMQSNSSMAQRALNIIRDVVHTHASHFKDNTKSDWFTTPPVYGERVSGGDYFFYARELRRILKEENFPADAVFRDWADNNFIVDKQNPAHKFQDRLNGKWMFHFPANVFED